MQKEEVGVRCSCIGYWGSNDNFEHLYCCNHRVPGPNISDLILPCNLTLLANVTHWQSKVFLLVLALYP